MFSTFRQNTETFGNPIPKSAYRKAVKSKEKFEKKYGDDSKSHFKVSITDAPCIGPILGVKEIGSRMYFLEEVKS